MRYSNRKVVLYLLEKGYTEIWLKPHGRRHDLVYKSKEKGSWYRALDLWNLWDGICLDPNNKLVFIQIKTNAWAKKQPIIEWVNKVKDSKAMVFNVRYSTTLKKWEVLERIYEHN